MCVPEASGKLTLPISLKQVSTMVFDDLSKIAWEEDAVNKVLQEDDAHHLARDEGTNDVDEQKVDTLQDASETSTRPDAEKQEVGVIGDVFGAETDLDQMLWSEVQDTRRESGGSGDDKAGIGGQGLGTWWG